MGRRYGLEIRAAAGTDAAGLSALLAEAGIAAAAPEVAARLDALQRAGGTALVALEWGPPSGLVAVQPCHALDAPRPFATVATLLVAPEARRRGIGRLLVKAAARAARQAGCDRLLLRAEAGTELAAFADAAGFIPDGTARARPLLRRGAGED